METVPGTTLDRVLTAVDERADEIVEFAAELIRQQPINPDLEPNDLAERPAQEWLRDQFQQSEAFDTVDSWEVAERRPNVVAVRKGSGAGRSLTWSAHTDVVPVTPEQAEQWSGVGPFSGEVRDGKLAAATRPIRVTDHASADVLPVFSPDGNKLMWTSNRTDDRESQLFIADFDLAAADKALAK